MSNHFNRNIVETNNKNIYKLSNKIELYTNKMKLLFPIEEKYNNIVMKMEFTDLETDVTMKQLLTNIQKIEEFYYNKLKNDYYKDTDLKMNEHKLTNLNTIQQLKTRTHLTTRSTAKGHHDVDQKIFFCTAKIEIVCVPTSDQLIYCSQRLWSC